MRAALVACALTLAACGGASGDGTPTPARTAPSMSLDAPTRTPTPKAPAAIRTIATGLRVPWGIAFEPSGDALVAERSTGRILRIPKGGGKPIASMQVPGVALEVGEGGLLGLAYRRGLVYAYFTSTEGDNRIARFRFGGPAQVILKGLRSGPIHNGGRIAFGPDGKLYAGVGETGEAGLAQDRSSLNGKILRMDPDGGVPRDNPFGTLVWTWGHRNVQGLAWDAGGRLWASEFGQDAFDEVNLIQKGRNYGWPEAEGIEDTRGGKYTNPLVIWPTSDASPSGAAVIGSNLYIGALRGECVWKIPLDGEKAGKPERLLAGRYGRIRTVVAAPDGTLWVGTSNQDGRGSPRSGDDRIVAVRV
jgi:glucose/arabinose dehydrogenase